MCGGCSENDVGARSGILIKNFETDSRTLVLKWREKLSQTSDLAEHASRSFFISSESEVLTVCLSILFSHLHSSRKRTFCDLVTGGQLVQYT